MASYDMVTIKATLEKKKHHLSSRGQRTRRYRALASAIHCSGLKFGKRNPNTLSLLRPRDITIRNFWVVTYIINRNLDGLFHNSAYFLILPFKGGVKLEAS